MFSSTHLSSHPDLEPRRNKTPGGKLTEIGPRDGAGDADGHSQEHQLRGEEGSGIVAAAGEGTQLRERKIRKFEAQFDASTKLRCSDEHKNVRLFGNAGP